MIQPNGIGLTKLEANNAIMTPAVPPHAVFVVCMVNGTLNIAYNTYNKECKVIVFDLRERVYSMELCPS
jgi:hypothetical protein